MKPLLCWNMYSQRLLTWREVGFYQRPSLHLLGDDLISNSFHASSFKLRSLMDLDIIFVLFGIYEFNFILLHGDTHFSVCWRHCPFFSVYLFCYRCQTLDGFNFKYSLLGFSILFHWSVFLFLCQYHIAFYYILFLLQYSVLKSEIAFSPVFLFFFPAWGLLLH